MNRPLEPEARTYDLNALAEFTTWAKELPAEPTNTGAIRTLMGLIEQAYETVMANGLERNDLYYRSNVIRDARDAYYTLFTMIESGDEQSFDNLILRCTWALNLAKHSIGTAEAARGPQQWNPRTAVEHLNTLENRLRELESRIPGAHSLLWPIAHRTARSMQETADRLRQAISAMDGVKRPCWAKPHTSRRLPPFKP